MQVQPSSPFDASWNFFLLGLPAEQPTFMRLSVRSGDAAPGFFLVGFYSSCSVLKTPRKTTAALLDAGSTLVLEVQLCILLP